MLKVEEFAVYFILKIDLFGKDYLNKYNFQHYF